MASPPKKTTTNHPHNTVGRHDSACRQRTDSIALLSNRCRRRGESRHEQKELQIGYMGPTTRHRFLGHKHTGVSAFRSWPHSHFTTIHSVYFVTSATRRHSRESGSTALFFAENPTPDQRTIHPWSQHAHRLHPNGHDVLLREKRVPAQHYRTIQNSRRP
jgi:hypothetical protein